MSVSRDILQAKLVKGSRGEVQFLISRKSCCTQLYRLLEEQVNNGKKNPRKYLDSAGGNFTSIPHWTIK